MLHFSGAGAAYRGKSKPWYCRFSNLAGKLQAMHVAWVKCRNLWFAFSPACDLPSNGLCRLLVSFAHWLDGWPACAGIHNGNVSCRSWATEQPAVIYHPVLLVQRDDAVVTALTVSDGVRSFAMQVAAAFGRTASHVMVACHTVSSLSCIECLVNEWEWSCC